MAKKAFPRFQRFMQKNTQTQRRIISRSLPILVREIKLQLSKGGTLDRKERWVPNPGRHLRVVDALLKNSWQAYGVKRDALGYYGLIASDRKYAAIHEYGGVTGHPNGQFDMPPRPYVHPAFEEKRAQLRKVISEELVKAMR